MQESIHTPIGTATVITWQTNDLNVKAKTKTYSGTFRLEDGQEITIENASKTSNRRGVTKPYRDRDGSLKPGDRVRLVRFPVDPDGKEPSVVILVE